MEKHTCKLCSRSFANGRALGGHMRSHLVASTKAAAAAAAAAAQLKDSSSSSPSETSSSRDEGDDKMMMMMMMGPLGYGLRENPKKSFRLVDPEFSSNFTAVNAAVAATPAAGSSIVVQDGESETESSRAPTTAHRRRSKRARKAAAAAASFVSSQPDPLPLAEPEPVSSVSDTTPEEDVAISLMMLSRDFWTPVTKSEEQQQQQQQSEHQFIIEDEEHEDEDEDEIEVEAYRASHQHHQQPVKGRSKYQCSTCKKVFRSYQALGGHRASHKKTNGCAPPPSPVAGAQLHIQYEGGNLSEANGERVQQHECPVCFRVFSSGQALGGHKRSHLTTSSSAAKITITSSSSIAPAPAASIAAAVAATKCESMIDLNLPAPMEDDAELSAVSDAEFVRAQSSN